MSSGDDEYVRKYMGGDRVRFVDKVRLPWWMNAALALGPLAGAVAVVAAGAPEAAPLVLAPGLLSWGVLSAIRVAVTDSHVHLQYGVFGPKIALADVVSVEAIDYSWLRYGGWGIRKSVDGSWAFSIPGRGGRAVRISYRDGNKQREVVVSSEQADALADAIRQAHTAATSAAARTLEEARAELLPAPEPATAEAHEVVDVIPSTADRTAR